MKKLTDLLLNLEIKCILGDVNKNITDIRINSNEIKKNNLFIAIKGEKTDGHNYITQAINKGAIAVISEQIVTDFIGNNIPIIIVNNSRKALATLSSAFYNFPANNFNITAVTGTNGKTTITHILKAIYEANGLKTGLIGTNGIQIGNKKIDATHTTPDPLELNKILNDMVNSDCQQLVMEVSSHALDQHRVDGINFNSVVFSNLTQDHLDYHKDMDTYARSKKLIFDSLNSESIAILNGDSDYSDFMVENTKAKICNVGRKNNNDIIIIDEVIGIDSSSFALKLNNYEFSSNNNSEDKNKVYKIETNMIGSFNIENLALACAVALSEGINFSIIKDVIKSGLKIKGRMEKFKLPNGALSIIDYAHTPDALKNALDSVREILNNSNTKGKLLLVFGCGGDRDTSKREIMGKIAIDNADEVFITNDNPRTEDQDNIIKDILSGIEKNQMSRVKIITDRELAIQEALNRSKENDIVLIAGKGHENYQVIGQKKLDFNDAEIVQHFNKY